MKKETIWIGLVILLILMNATILFLFLGGKAPKRPGPGDLHPKDKLIIEALSFDKAQQAKFMDLKEEHRNQIRHLNSKANRIVDSYFTLLQAQEIDLVKKDSLESEFASIEKEKMNVTFDHFQKLKNSCSPSQKKKFDAFLPDLIQLVMPPRQEKLVPPRRD